MSSILARRPKLKIGENIADNSVMTGFIVFLDLSSFCYNFSFYHKDETLRRIWFD